jgi:hypothetical protein
LCIWVKVMSAATITTTKPTGNQAGTDRPEAAVTVTRTKRSVPFGPWPVRRSRELSRVAGGMRIVSSRVPAGFGT